MCKRGPCGRYGRSEAEAPTVAIPALAKVLTTNWRSRDDSAGEGAFYGEDLGLIAGVERYRNAAGEHVAGEYVQAACAARREKESP